VRRTTRPPHPTIALLIGALRRTCALRRAGALRLTFALSLACALPLTAALGQVPPTPRATPAVASPLGWALTPWLEGLALPVAVATVPDRPDRWLVVQLEGLILDVRGREVVSRPFLDLRHRITGLAGEQGLFTVTVEPLERARARGRPRYAVAAFTERDSGDVVVAAYPVDEGAWRADAAGEVVVLRVPVPEPFHHGGQVRFGPDGYLYASIGNGESSNRFLEERPWSSASLASLRGKLLRIDLLPGAGPDPAYAVPPDNPFVRAPAGPDGAVRPEIWALGFRNPWKFTFDPGSGALIAVDVGDDAWEEVNLVVPGGHYGWPSREGHGCLAWPDRPGLVDPDCAAADLVAPWIAYGHPRLDPDGGRAVVGGVVVRDPDLPALRGRYLFGDFVFGRVWAYDPTLDRRELLLEVPGGLTAIDEGPAGEVLLVGVRGVVERLVAAE